MAQLKALFLDRDDTIIKNIPYMSKVEDIEYLPGVFKALKFLQDEKGFSIFIVTNQSGLSRGLITYQELEDIHDKISEDFFLKGLRILKYYISPYIHIHHRRKPGPGLLLEAQQDFDIDFSQSVMVGDGDRDVDAGYNAGLTKCFKVTSPDFWEQVDLGLF